jgi:GNAT superfamily N-acetyltransferase
MAHSDNPLGERSPLQPGEIGRADALVSEVGWNQTERDWWIFLKCGSVQAIRDGDGLVVATAATLPYDGFGWVSMVIVTAPYRRQGLAARLLGGAIDDLRGAGLVPVLDATPAGREVYQKLGFQDTWGFARYARPNAPRSEAPPSPATGISVRPITDDVWPELCRLDTDVFGADRRHLLARLSGRAPAAELVALRGNAIAGFLLGREGRLATHFGPLVADDTAAAHVLLAGALAAVPGPIFIDLVDSKPEIRRFLEVQGFTFSRPLTRMVLGRSEAFDDGRRTFAVIGPEFG